MQILHWRKSTYSGDSSNCLEIAPTSTTLHVRDSKMADSPHLVFHSSVWALFTSHTASHSPSTQAMENP